MQRIFVILALLAPTAALAGEADKPLCPFTYSEDIRRNVVEPEIARMEPQSAGDFDTKNPRIDIERGLIHLQIELGPDFLDGDTVVMTIDPCTGKIVNSAVFDAFPEFTTCSPDEEKEHPGAWCVQPREGKN